MAKESLMATNRQVMYLHDLGKQVGKYETYEELDKLTMKEARRRISDYLKIIKMKAKK